ncbi:hypothetical protein [Rubrobacter tropicus]|uniref:hypothetical protein n=1 Tax=Rubrobacter tropicus TaxID=2653851 RepID=UPI00140972F1|nr:hypothetical protein [Rubrobacter tropicus]
MIQTCTVTRQRPATPLPRPFILAAVLLAFALFYPYLDAAGLCGEAGCPHFLQSHAPASAELPSATLAAVAAVAAPPLVRSFGPRPASDRRPAQVYADLEPEPPRP